MPFSGDVSLNALRAERGPLIRRSELACPAHSLKMMAKAAGSEADQVMFDLEDACAVSQKVSARDTLVEALTTLDFGTKIRTFRPNDVHSPYFYRDLIDVVERAGPYIDGVVIPKVGRAADVQFVDILLTQIELNVGLPSGKIFIEVLIESAEAVLHAEEIALASPRNSGLIFGLVDFAADIGARAIGSDQFQVFHYARAKTVIAARAAGITCVDGVTLAIRDMAACRRDATVAGQMGFDGKWAIHPDQVSVINECFTPTLDEIAHARKIVDAYELADVGEGKGAIVIDDEMVDAASIRLEQRKLAIARRAGLA